MTDVFDCINAKVQKELQGVYDAYRKVYDYEDCDGDDAIMIPISQVKCCGEWVGDQKVYAPLEFVEKTLPASGSVVSYWQCPVCKGCY